MKKFLLALAALGLTASAVPAVAKPQVELGVSIQTGRHGYRYYDESRRPYYSYPRNYYHNYNPYYNYNTYPRCRSRDVVVRTSEYPYRYACVPRRDYYRW